MNELSHLWLLVPSVFIWALCWALCHHWLTKKALALELEIEEKKLRDRIKSSNFGLMYGMDPAVVRDHTAIIAFRQRPSEQPVVLTAEIVPEQPDKDLWDHLKDS